MGHFNAVVCLCCFCFLACARGAPVLGTDYLEANGKEDCSKEQPCMEAGFTCCSTSLGDMGFCVEAGPLPEGLCEGVPGLVSRKPDVERTPEELEADHEKVLKQGSDPDLAINYSPDAEPRALHPHIYLREKGKLMCSLQTRCPNKGAYRCCGKPNSTTGFGRCLLFEDDLLNHGCSHRNLVDVY